MKIVLVVCAVLMVLLVISLICLKFVCNRYDSVKDQLNRKSEAYKNLLEEFEIYRNAEQFKYEKEKEANEKINDLHNGTLSADDILPKRKS